MISQHRLDSGLHVVVDAGGSTPVASVQLWFSLGSAWEPVDRSGAAHLLEHMLFKASDGLPAGEAVARLEAVGGSPNAWTSLEQTALFVTLPARHLPLAVETLATMALRPRLEEDELSPERGVVIEEIREYDDDPEDLLARTLRQRCFGDHPYARPILGTEDSVKALTAARLQGFHAAHYRPAHATLVVAGPVDTDEVLALARAHLGGGGPAPERAVPDTALDPVSPGAFCLDKGFDERLVELAIPLPPLGHPDLPALDLLIVGLGQGSSSELHRVLRHDRDLCMGAWAAIENERAGGLLVAGLSARKGQARDAAAGLCEVVRRVHREGLGLGALRRARAAVRADRLRDQESVDGRASRAAWYAAAFGDVEADLAYEAALQRVTVADLRRVARRWLAPERWVLGALAPADELSEADLQALCDAPAKAPSQTASAHRHTVAKLSCGATLLVEPDPGAQVVGLSVVALGGQIAAGARNAGLPSAWAALLTRGAGERDAMAFAAAVEEQAGSMGAWAARSSCGLHLWMPGDEISRAVELLASVLLTPTFAPDEVERTRADLLEVQRTARDDAGELARLLTGAALFGGHPWGWPSEGTPASARRLSRGRLLRYHRRVMAGSNLALGVSGAVDPAEVVHLLDRALARVEQGEPVEVAPPTLPDSFRRRRRATIPRPGSPTEVVVAFPAPGQDSPQEPALRVLEAVLGGVGGGSGRLFDRMREREGLAYSVSAQSAPGLGGGAFGCAVTTDPQRARDARRALWDELDRLVADGVPDDELERVRSGLVERGQVGVQRAISRADHLAATERYLGDGGAWRRRLTAPAEVTGAQVQSLARQILRHDRSVEVQVGPKEEA